ncbi:glycosyltransferase [Dietzia cercidiphylli]|nr:glycosyltransferase [Dietzia cercidiphylli]
MASHLSAGGYNVSVVSPGTRADEEYWVNGEGVDWRRIAVFRNPSPIRDIRSLCHLLILLIVERPTVAIWGSPKISLLGTLASRLVGVPSVYVIHGLRYEGSTGFSRRLLIWFERFCVRMSTSTVAVGYQVREVALKDGLGDSSKIQVLANGSANSYRDPVFVPNAKESFGVGSTCCVFTFAGRLTGDKGIRDLLDAWKAFIASEESEAILLVVGGVESDLAESELLDEILSQDSVQFLGHLSDMSLVYSATDVLLLPSYREGLPTVVLEAASFGIPAIVADSTGTAEPVVDGYTGLVFPVRECSKLHSAMVRLAADKEFRQQLGASACLHVRESYGPDVVYSAWLRLIEQLAADESY